MEKAIALMSADLFKAIPTDEVALIAAKTEEVRFRAGETPESNPANFYLILEGEVEQRREGVVVRRAVPGAGFGLFGLLGFGEAEVETRILADTRAIAISQEAFVETVADHPAFAIAFIRGISGTIRMMADRIQKLEKKLAAFEGRESDAPPDLPG